MTVGTISFQGLTKQFGRGPGVLAVDGLTVDVLPGRITAFLGPNGAGKTTTLRCLLGLVQPSAGTALLDGHRYEDLPDPVHRVGAALEAAGFYPGRRARDHVRVIADAGGLPGSRADEVLRQVGLEGAERRRIGEFSLGMRQRLLLAVALLGDPQFLILDEPANGLDPQGIAWLRGFLRHLASQGRTILISSHVLAEVQQTADDVIIINSGRLVTAQPLAALEGMRGRPVVEVASPEAERLATAILAEHPDVGLHRDVDHFTVTGVTAPQVGRIAHLAGIELHGLSQRLIGLEELFLELTSAPATSPNPTAAAGWDPPSGEPVS